MENLGSVPAAAGSLSTYSSPTSDVYKATTERQSFRFLLSITPGEGRGDIAATLTLDSTIQSSFLDCYEFFSLEEVTVDLQCVAPLGTASGGMLAAYIVDPLGATIPTEREQIIEKFGVTEGAIFVRPRDSKALHIPCATADPIIGKYRYVVNGTDPRLSSFGTLFFVTTDPPAVGDGSRWEAWVHGYVVGHRRTLQMGVAVARSITYIDSGRVVANPSIAYTPSRATWVLKFEVPLAGGQSTSWFPSLPSSLTKIAYTFDSPIYLDCFYVTDSVAKQNYYFAFTIQSSSSLYFEKANGGRIFCEVAVDLPIDPSTVLDLFCPPSKEIWLPHKGLGVNFAYLPTSIVAKHTKTFVSNPSVATFTRTVKPPADCAILGRTNGTLVI